MSPPTSPCADTHARTHTHTHTHAHAHAHAAHTKTRTHTRTRAHTHEHTRARKYRHMPGPGHAFRVAVGRRAPASAASPRPAPPASPSPPPAAPALTPVLAVVRLVAAARRAAAAAADRVYRYAIPPPVPLVWGFPRGLAAAAPRNLAATAAEAGQEARHGLLGAADRFRVARRATAQRALKHSAEEPEAQVADLDARVRACASQLAGPRVRRHRHRRHRCPRRRRRRQPGRKRDSRGFQIEGRLGRRRAGEHVKANERAAQVLRADDNCPWMDPDAVCRCTRAVFPRSLLCISFRPPLSLSSLSLCVYGSLCRESPLAVSMRRGHRRCRKCAPNGMHDCLHKRMYGMYFNAASRTQRRHVASPRTRHSKGL
jgi:hypothetical protein